MDDHGPDMFSWQQIWWTHREGQQWYRVAIEVSLNNACHSSECIVLLVNHSRNPLKIRYHHSSNSSMMYRWLYNISVMQMRCYQCPSPMTLHTITPDPGTVWCCIIHDASSLCGTGRHVFVHCSAVHRRGIHWKTWCYVTGSSMRSILGTTAIANTCAAELMECAAMAA